MCQIRKGRLSKTLPGLTQVCPTCEKKETTFGIFTYAKTTMDGKSHTSPMKNLNPTYNPVISMSPKSASKRVPLGNTLGGSHWSVPILCLFSCFSRDSAPSLCSGDPTLLHARPLWHSGEACGWLLRKTFFFFFFDAWSKIHKITKETYFINIVINIFLKSKLVVKKWAYLLLQEITRLSHGSNSYCHFKVIKVNGI